MKTKIIKTKNGGSVIRRTTRRKPSKGVKFSSYPNECDWCSDSMCKDYWKIRVFQENYLICDCCYNHLEKKEREE